jgi:hypothetical protein
MLVYQDGGVEAGERLVVTARVVQQHGRVEHLLHILVSKAETIHTQHSTQSHNEEARGLCVCVCVCVCACESRLRMSTPRSEKKKTHTVHSA